MSAAWSQNVPAATAAAARPATFEFDLAAMPLQSALERYSALTGWSVLYRGGLTDGRMSSPVRGRFDAATALRMLLEGTGMNVQAAGRERVVLLPTTQLPVAAAATPVPAHVAYYGQAQARLRQAFCGDPRLKPGSYRAALRLDVAPDGRVRQARLLDTTGDSLLDRTVVEAVSALSLAPPPKDMAQPLTLLILPRAMAGSDDCAIDGAASGHRQVRAHGR